MRGIEIVYATYNAFVAVKPAHNNGMFWGNPDSAGECRSLDFTGVKAVYATGFTTKGSVGPIQIMVANVDLWFSQALKLSMPLLLFFGFEASPQ